ncbi:MAG: hypothetical protein RLZZ324_1208 [Candidatus Parcubacteria bacterium]|jgi:ribose 5-phosphate isomerase B
MPKTLKPAIHLAADHAGLKLKNAVKLWLAGNGYHVHDHGALTADAKDDYPDFIIPAARAVAAAPRGRTLGIVFGGSGNGEAIAANKVRGVRAALAYDAWSARLSREHNDANVLSLGGRALSPARAVALVKVWLGARFSGDARHARRLKKIAQYEGGKVKR